MVQATTDVAHNNSKTFIAVIISMHAIYLMERSLHHHRNIAFGLTSHSLFKRDSIADSSAKTDAGTSLALLRSFNIACMLAKKTWISPRVIFHRRLSLRHNYSLQLHTFVRVAKSFPSWTIRYSSPKLYVLCKDSCHSFKVFPCHFTFSYISFLLAFKWPLLSHQTL